MSATFFMSPSFTRFNQLHDLRQSKAQMLWVESQLWTCERRFCPQLNRCSTLTKVATSILAEYLHTRGLRVTTDQGWTDNQWPFKTVGNRCYDAQSTGECICNVHDVSCEVYIQFVIRLLRFGFGKWWEVIEHVVQCFLLPDCLAYVHVIYSIHWYLPCSQCFLWSYWCLCPLMAQHGEMHMNCCRCHVWAAAQLWSIQWTNQPLWNIQSCSRGGWLQGVSVIMMFKDHTESENTYP